jgi:alpha-L-rhamnosidase
MEALGEDPSEYRSLYKKIVTAFRKKYSNYRTQTECAVALYFGLAADPAATAAQLAQLVRDNGNRQTTGFIGTPYLLHALSENGYAELAYTLLLQQECPSWLFSVRMGATTIWEHWDSRKADGSFWSTDMNSFNHYAYGSVADWMYAVPGGIRLDHPGYDKLTLQPVADARLRFFEACVDTVRGTVRTHWHWEDKDLVFRFDTPVAATVVLPDGTHQVSAGQHEFRISQ